ncbi:hypothetical protein S7711_08505 [Stachybotrys chartarum IBT 7711]|uniref:Uncharacterized protein n=1 Tax=Stachybotrys chartarum (strain CBS 109288 / IBT 7711) TaxID=1280523 RepID=A0A084BAE2_STACB|nr:hypothetical protein S7711_08505 [Stachybotrys chartarum IBT 7711]KFA54586.1 hypothetical protein S40293_02266 [Stachybotrys chartarum IBT 40293]
MLSCPNEENACIETSSAGTSEVVEEGEDRVPRAPFARPHEMTLEWLHDLTHLGNHVDSSEENTPSANDGDNPLFQHANYEQFVRGSGAYQWLLSKLRQHDQLTCENNSCLNEFGSRIRTHLGAEGYGRKLSRRKPLATVTIKFVLNWNPQKFLQRVEFDFQSPEKIRNMLCMTGTPNGAQALTVAEYMAMVWPGTWEPLMDLITKLITIPEGHMCVNQMVKSHPGQFKNIDHQRLSAQIQGHSSCLIQVSGGVHFVSEIAEQIGWLASAMTCPSSMSRGSVVTCRPMMTSLQRAEEATAAYTGETWKCHLTFAMDSVESEPQNPSGFCWRSLLWNTVLIQGYPIQSRAVPQTGLEISLKNLAICIRSQQIVRWNDRIIMKGFGSLVVATLLTAGLVVWHLLDSGDTERRISYVDPKIDKLDLHLPQGFDLRSLERCRHVVGWCASATDMCGETSCTALIHNVGSCGLPRPPASIIIDRLYIEGGSGAIGGLSMAINKKQQPFWLEREKDYPSLLRWASLQPIVFYDVSTRQAWLIDGASALLQLVRISLHLDENDPESTYDWVFNSDQLKDRWHGCSGRQAALRTLKAWDNLTLNLYVISKRLINGKMTTEYATLEQRVKSILHSLEILIDRQVQVASQEGISLPQSLNFHHSIAGFDILDVISPLGPIVPCSQNLETSGRGWKDLVSAIGVTTIFGRGFGNLIRPNDSSPICDNWTSVPIGQDYMAASVSTLKMLYERRMCRLWPGLRIGELTSKIMWLSALPHRPCNCSNPGTSRRTCSHDPVQFIVSKRAWNIRSMTKQMTPVDVAKLDNAGAFIFGHVSARRVRGDEWQDATGEEQGTELGEIPTDSSTSSAPVRNRPHAPSLSTTTSAAASATTPPTSTTTPSREDSQESGSNRLNNASEDRHSMADDTTGRGTKKRSKIVQRIRGMF